MPTKMVMKLNALSKIRKIRGKTLKFSNSLTKIWHPDVRRKILRHHQIKWAGKPETWFLTSRRIYFKLSGDQKIFLWKKFGFLWDGRFSRNLSASRYRHSRGFAPGPGLKAMRQSGPGQKSARQFRHQNSAGEQIPTSRDKNPGQSRCPKSRECPLPYLASSIRHACSGFTRLSNFQRLSQRPPLLLIFYQVV